MLLFLISLLFQTANAETLSARPTHPIGWQHMLPGGETPGWTSDKWVEFELSNANNWAAPATFLNRRTGKELTFTADFEQTTIYVEMGRALSKNWAIALEVPYAARHEGSSTDKIIDDFHDAFKFDNFGRPLYPYGQKIFETSTDGVRRGPYTAPSGAGNLKLKIKYWPVQWERSTGVGMGLHIKAPIEDREKGMTSGEVDATGMLNVAVPFGEKSAMYTTFAATYAKHNWMFADWPRHTTLLTFDIYFDFAIFEKWGIIFDFLYSSPLMKKRDLEFQYKGTTDKEKTYEKIASGYNSLVEFRGQQTIGLRRTFSEKSKLLIYIVEDWGPGDRDHNNDMVYSMGQPDFGIGTKFIYGF